MGRAQRISPPRQPEPITAGRLRLRRHERLSINVRAIVYTEGAFVPTVIRDISVGGVGLSGAHGLFPGQRITLALLTGEKQDGVVRWWLNDCCGVQFPEVLTEDDAFLAAALRRGSSMWRRRAIADTPAGHMTL